MGSNSKISLIEKIMMGFMVISADVADALATLGIPLPLIGPTLPFISFFYGFVISAILLFWIIMKGVSVRWFLGGSGIELVPFLNGLPARSAALLVTFIEDSAPPRSSGGS